MTRIPKDLKRAIDLINYYQQAYGYRDTSESFIKEMNEKYESPESQEDKAKELLKIAHNLTSRLIDESLDLNLLGQANGLKEMISDFLEGDVSLEEDTEL